MDSKAAFVGLVGEELYGARTGSSDQQQKLEELLGKRFAETSFDRRSILDATMALAAEYDKADVVPFSLERGVDVGEDDMQIIAICSSFASHKVMIAAKAVDINYCPPISGDMLSFAATSNNLEWAEFCLQNGALPNSSEVDNYKPVIAAAAEEGFQEMVNLPVQFGAAIRRSSTIVLAAEAGQIEMVRLLLRKGADVNEVGRTHPFYESNEAIGTPLHRAIANGHFETAKLLIEHGADLTLQDGLMRAPEMVAERYGETEILNMLRGNGSTQRGRLEFGESSHKGLIHSDMDERLNLDMYL